MTACDAMTVAAVARKTSGQRPQSGTSRKNGLAMLARVVEDQRALTHVAQDAGREDEQQPRAGDRRAAEVPHVGVQRLGAGDREHDGGQREERDREVVEEEVERVGRRERLEDLRVIGDPADAARRRSIRNQTIITGPNRRPTPAVPMRWSRNSATMMAAVIGTTRCVQRRLGDLESLDRRQHRDRRRDHAVAQEQRGAEDPERRQQRAWSDGSPAVCWRRIRVIRAMMPPSPSLSARMTSST